MKKFEGFNLVCFNDPDVVALFDGATTRYEVTHPSAIEKLKLARTTERRKFWNWLLDVPNSALIATQLLSMHSTASTQFGCRFWINALQTTQKNACSVVQYILKFYQDTPEFVLRHSETLFFLAGMSQLPPRW